MTFPNAQKKVEIAERRKAVAEMLLRGVSQTAIAEKLSVDRKTVYSDIQAVQKSLLEDAKAALEEKRALDIAKLQRVEREAWDGWQRSQKDKQKTTVKQKPVHVGNDDNGVPQFVNQTEQFASSEGQAGDSSFLGRAESAIMSQAKLQGLLKQEVEVTGPEGGPIPITVVEVVKSDAAVPGPGGNTPAEPPPGPGKSVE